MTLRKNLHALFLAGLLLVCLPVALLAQEAETSPDPQSLAAKVIIIAGIVVAVLQGIKKLFPAIGGTAAIAFNIVLSAGGAFAVADPGQVFSLAFLAQVVLTALGAAGIHDALRRPASPA